MENRLLLFLKIHSFTFMLLLIHSSNTTTYHVSGTVININAGVITIVKTQNPCLHEAHIREKPYTSKRN